MIVHSLHNSANLPASIKPMCLMQGATDNAVELDRIAGELAQGRRLFMHVPLDPIDAWYRNSPDEVVKRAGIPPTGMVEQVRDAFGITAHGLISRGAVNVSLAYLNCEAIPSLTGAPFDYIGAMTRARSSPNARSEMHPDLYAIDPRSYKGHQFNDGTPYPTVRPTREILAQYPGTPCIDFCTTGYDQWNNATNGVGYDAARTLWDRTIGGAYLAAVKEVCGPILELCEKVVISPSAAMPALWTALDLGGRPIFGGNGKYIDSPQCYGVGTWPGLLSTLDLLLARPRVEATICPPEYAGCSWKQYGTFLGLIRAMTADKAEPTLWANDYTQTANLARAIDYANSMTITSDLQPRRPLDLCATSLSINGVHVTQSGWLSMGVSN